MTILFGQSVFFFSCQKTSPEVTFSRVKLVKLLTADCSMTRRRSLSSAAGCVWLLRGRTLTTRCRGQGSVLWTSLCCVVQENSAELLSLSVYPQKWQRRFFILYEDGRLSFALDDLVRTQTGQIQDFTDAVTGREVPES